jgi:hypothetical protein
VSTKKRKPQPPTTPEEDRADLMAILADAKPLTMADWDAFIGTKMFTLDEFPQQPTDDQVLYARVKHAVKPGQRRELLKKWERYLRTDAAIKAERARFKRLPNGAAEDVFQGVSDDLKGTPYAASWKTIRKDYYWIVGRIRKATAGE